MTLRQLWHILRNKCTRFTFANMSMANYPNGIPSPRETVTIYVPDGYNTAEEFLKDCQFEQAEPPAINLGL